MPDSPRIGQISECNLSNQSHIGQVTDPNRKYIFEWVILDFLWYNSAAAYFSPKFEMLNLECCFKIYFNRFFNIDNRTVSFISLYLMTDNDSNDFKSFKLAFAIKTSRGNKYERTKDFSNSTIKVIGFSHFKERHRLIEENHLLVPKGGLTVACTVNVETQKNYSRLNKLSEDLKHFYSLKKHCDVIFRINDDTIHAHKAILAARSSVFDAMFENDTEEKKTGIVTITDCDRVTFNVFLHCIYTGEADFSKCDVFQLYKIADKYCVLELMQMCMDFIFHNLSIETLFETFVFSKHFNQNKLLTECQSFFCKNFRHIVYSGTWKFFMHENPGTANKLLQVMADRQQEKQD